MYRDDLIGMTFLGEVINRDDPDKEGKVVVKIHGKFDELEDEDLPWVRFGGNTTSGSDSGNGSFDPPKVGCLVEVRFDNGNLYSPKYFNLFNLSAELQEKLSADGYYENAKVLSYDTELNLFIYYIRNSNEGLVIRTITDSADGSNQIQFKEDNSIQIKTKNNKEVTLSDDKIFLKFANDRIIDINQQNISIGSEDRSAEPALLGDTTAALYKESMEEMDAICAELMSYVTKQTAVAGSISFLAPLVPGFTALNISMTILRAKIGAIIVKIPSIKSTNLTID